MQLALAEIEAHFSGCHLGFCCRRGTSLPVNPVLVLLMFPCIHFGFLLPTASCFSACLQDGEHTADSLDSSSHPHGTTPLPAQQAISTDSHQVDLRAGGSHAAAVTPELVPVHQTGVTDKPGSVGEKQAMFDARKPVGGRKVCSCVHVFGAVSGMGWERERLCILLSGRLYGCAAVPCTLLPTLSGSQQKDV